MRKAAAAEMGMMETFILNVVVAVVKSVMGLATAGGCRYWEANLLAN